jgi:hypothetical protein
MELHGVLLCASLWNSVVSITIESHGVSGSFQGVFDLTH